MSKQYDKEFKENAVRYYHEHKDLNMKRCATNLGIAASTLGDWVKKEDINDGQVLELEDQVIIQVMKQKKMQN